MTNVKDLDEQIPAVCENISQDLKEEAVHRAKVQTTRAKTEDAAATATEPSSDTPTDSDTNIGWKPDKNRKITTNKSVVLENSTHGFKKPSILDAKLGRRLWADDAPQEKRDRFDAITKVTTNGSHGFRIAGMRIYKGSDNPDELTADSYRVYNKDHGRFKVNKDNVVDEFRRFIFNSRAGIDEELGQAIAQLFLVDLKRVEQVLASEESRMYSASLLFIFEGDGEALRAAIEKMNELAAQEKKVKAKHREAVVVENAESTIEGDVNVMEMMGDVGDEDEDSNDEEVTNLPRIYSLKLIDFAHAHWVPGQGPDENVLIGVRSLIKIFEELAQ
ncbi:hypothetical protein N0V88_002752 [Collariella sp. IMI 366227]|nr:hypothetical protein N0V88_002752 [Collariella sp. IMI 366227]